MISPSSANADLNARKGILAWMTILPALFPLVALLTYDWRAIPALNMPPTQSTNWIGALGDFFLPTTVTPRSVLPFGSFPFSAFSPP